MATSSKAGLRHIAVIPARGGSKRLPRKNIIDFFGMPIIAYTIAAAHEAAVFDRVIVSTEDATIADIAKKCQAEVDTRSPALASDEATIDATCVELLARLEQAGERYDTLSVLYATAPLRNADDIRATLALLTSDRCDFAMGVSEFRQSVHQALIEDGDGTLVPKFPDLVTKRASTVGRFYAGNGSVYCVRVPAFLKVRTFYGQPLRGHVMPPERSVDIDTAEDLAIAKFYGRRLRIANVGDDGE
jgi:pseudaminic acid cytidylyltransferase